MSKLIGYCEMKTKHGKVLFVTKENVKGVVGTSCDKMYVYDEVSDKITSDMIGKDIQLTKGLSIK